MLQTSNFDIYNGYSNPSSLPVVGKNEDGKGWGKGDVSWVSCGAVLRGSYVNKNDLEKTETWSAKGTKRGFWNGSECKNKNGCE